MNKKIIVALFFVALLITVNRYQHYKISYVSNPNIIHKYEDGQQIKEGEFFEYKNVDNNLSDMDISENSGVYLNGSEYKYSYELEFFHKLATPAFTLMDSAGNPLDGIAKYSSGTYMISSKIEPSYMMIYLGNEKTPLTILLK